jgi:hypothetical protein
MARGRRMGTMNKIDVIETYPLVFRKGRATAVYIEDGWLPLLAAVCEKLEEVIRTLPEEDQPHYHMRETGEKFAALNLRFAYPSRGTQAARFGSKHHPPRPPGPGYNAHAVKRVKEIIEMARSLSCGFCEVCGNHGQVRWYGWQKTHCDDHYDPEEDRDGADDDYEVDRYAVPENPTQADLTALLTRHLGEPTPPTIDLTISVPLGIDGNLDLAGATADLTNKVHAWRDARGFDKEGGDVLVP